MKKTLIALLALVAFMPLSGRAQNSESLNIAADQEASMNKRTA